MKALAWNVIIKQTLLFDIVTSLDSPTVPERAVRAVAPGFWALAWVWCLLFEAWHFFVVSPRVWSWNNVCVDV